jgi:hypothetical protein
MAEMTWGTGPSFDTEHTFMCRGCAKTLTATPREAHEIHKWDVPPYFTLTSCSTACTIKYFGASQ